MAASTGASQAPFHGEPAEIPGRIQAQDFDLGGQNVAYFDTSPHTNQGGQYRPDEGVDIEVTHDSLGGDFNVGWIDAGEWLEYTVDVQSGGEYELRLRLARAPSGTSQMHVRVAGEDVTGPVVVPHTGGWQNWTTVVVENVFLDPGEQVMRLAFDGGGFNVNWAEMVLVDGDAIRPPEVSLTEPWNGQVFGTGADIAVSAHAVSRDDEIASVEFFADSQSIGGRSSPPWSVVWENPPEGEHTLTALATGTEGRSTTSLPVTISVEEGFVAPRLDLGMPPREALHRSSRRTGMVISEIMYRPAPRADGGILEYVELYNSEPVPAEIGGWRLGGTVDYVFPDDTVIPGESFLVVAADPAGVVAEYGLSGVLGPYQGSLDRDEGEVLLFHRIGGLLLEAEYSARHPWPAAAAGAGHSLVLARPSYGEGDVLAWEASAFRGGSPGELDPRVSGPLESIKINEFLAREEDEGSLLSFIELYNHSADPVDVSGARLAGGEAETQFTIPSGTTVPPGGFLVYDETELGFRPDASGDAIYWISPDGERVIDAIRFEPQADGLSAGRHPDGAREFRRLAEPSPGASNGAPFESDVIINEIMFNPISGEDEDTYLELYNRGDSAVDLSAWRFTDGIRFTFPRETVLGAGEYLVVARDRERLIARYPQLNSGNTVGNFGGRLANSGERLALAKAVERSGGRTDHVVVDEVSYRDGGRWGEWANRDGSSLELRDPRSDNRRAANWTHSDETAKSEWVLIEHTGVLDHGTGPANQLHILLPSAGHVLIDEVEVRVEDGPNLVANGTFATGSAGWEAQGHHVTSHWVEEGYQSGGSLRLEASGGGDTGANRVRVELTESLQAGQTATLRARARWLAGHRQVLLRLRGNYLEAMGDLHIPSNLGTPGAPNSALIGNAGPAIYDVRQSPSLPAAHQPLTVTARATDPDGIEGLTLFYRIDPGEDYTALPMSDDGQTGDAVAGDGLYTALIPGQPSGTLVAYFIEAEDGAATPAFASYPDDPTAYEALVRFGDEEQSGSYPSYHMWFTEAVMNEWAQRERLSNRRLPGTLVSGDRVIHNIAARYRGSPFARPSGFSFQVPRDDRLLGTREFNLNNIIDLDGTGQREGTGYWIGERLGLPFSHQTYIHVFRNGNKPLGGGVFADIQHIESEYLQAWFPDDDRGELFKIDDWFEFSDDLGSFSSVDARLQPHTTTGGELKKARYRWSWNKRSNRWLDDDYSSFFQLVEAVNTPGDTAYTAAVEAVADIEQWMRVFAARRVVSDWDGYGYSRGKNAWTYNPQNRGWQMILWDLDKGMGAWASPPDAALFGADDPTVTRMDNHPPFRRAYWRAFHDAVYGPLQGEEMNRMLDANYAALTANGFEVEGPQAIKNWVSDRRNFLIDQLNTVSADLAITGPEPGHESGDPRVTLTGTAPVEVKTLTINGGVYPLNWNSETEWSVSMPLLPGENVFLVEGWNSDDRWIDETGITVTYAADPAEAADPADHLVINELLHDPAQPGSEFVEIHNTSEEYAFDLSGYRLDGLGFTFASGTVIEPGGYSLAVRNRFAFQNRFGLGLPIAGEFSGMFWENDEPLRLIRPATDADPERVIDEVYALPSLPWPSVNGLSAASYQRIDPARSGAHPGNWAYLGDSEGLATDWQFVSVTGEIVENWFYLYLEAPGEVHVDAIELVPGTEPGVGENMLLNGDFESELSGPWVVADNHADSRIVTDVSYSGNASLHVVADSGGSTLGSSISQNRHEEEPTEEGELYTLSYRYLPNENGAPLTTRFRWSGHGPGRIDHTQQTTPQPAAPATPGEINSVRADLPPFPDLWLNELQPVNTGAVTDGFGEADPWVELYHAGEATLSLEGYYLSNDSEDLSMWAFPEGAMLEPESHTLVWLDGQPEQTGPGEWHTDFVIDPDAGELYLSRAVDGKTIMIDAFAYDGLPAGHSIGRHPDGGIPPLVRSSTPTPASANTTPPLALLHYWHFNDSGNLTAPAHTLGGAAWSIATEGLAETVSGDGQGFSGENARFNDPAGDHLRVNYPLDATVHVSVPTTGYRDVLVRYETRRSGQGAGLQVVDYTTDGATYAPFKEIVVTEEPVVRSLDFGALESVADNPDFALRIRFQQGDGGTEGNNRFDNFTVEGSPLAGVSSPPAVNAPPSLFKRIEQGDPIEIDLSEVFTSTDGEPLTFSATVEENDVLEHSLSGELLTLQPANRGDARVELTAESASNEPVSVVFRVLVYPAPHDLAEAPYFFDSWPADAPAWNYPEHMLFVQSDESDTAIDTPLEFAYRIPPEEAAREQDVTFPYRAESRTRINGLGPQGIAFINTGRGRDLGGALLALDTRGVDQAPVSWLGGTVLPNDRIYAIRLQYRVGIDGDFVDVLDEQEQPVEYLRHPEIGHVEPMGPVALPPDALGEEYVQLMWRYYRIAGDSGPRAQLRLDAVQVANREPGTAVALAFADPPPEWSQSRDPLPPIAVSAVDQDGLVDPEFEGPASLNLSGDGELSGVATGEFEDGIAVFPGLSIDGAGPFTFTASASGLAGAESDVFHVVRVTEKIMPRYMQGDQDENNDNNDRVPFAFRLTLEGLKPEAEYRFGNRVVTPDDPPDQDGAGNAILIAGAGDDWVRNTDSPRFREDDLGLRHQTFVTDENGAHTGWFVTEPTGNARFTPGNTVFIRLLLNDGEGGESLFHFLTTRQEIEVIRFGEGSDEGSAVMGDAEIAPRNVVVLYDDEDGESRPLAATPVEITGAETDDRYAAFYDTTVATNDGFWGALIPNELPGGVKRIEERSLQDGSIERVHSEPDGFAGTVNPSGGLTPIFLEIRAGDPIGSFEEWRQAMFDDPDATPEASAAEADPHGSGVTNLARYAFGIDLDEDPVDKLPRLIVTGEELRLAFPFSTHRADIAYIVEASEDLVDWSETIFDSRVDSPGIQEGILDISLPESSGNRKFHRVRISQQ